MKNNIAIIPARGGSKRIKFKNKKYFFGKPVIVYSILTAKKSSLFKKIIVTTDDFEIAKISKKYGASVEFIRPKLLSKNNVGILRVIKHTINFYRNKKIKFDNVCCILPVAPLLDVSKIKKGYKLLKLKNSKFVFSAIRSSSKDKKFFTVDNQKKIKNISYKFKKGLFSDAGQFYWGSYSSWTNEKKIFSNESVVLKMMSSDAIDVNDNNDWKNLLIKYKKKYL
tara:strand:+ start:1215 stop:1886 length:672 start_codon:yes stop_codon:yes gene_type:complete